MTAEQKRQLKKVELFEKGHSFLITDPINKELLDMLIEDVLKRFKAFYSRYDKRLLAKGFRSYKYTINGCMVHIETTYKRGCKCGQTYDLNAFL